MDTNLTLGRKPTKPMFVMWRGEKLEVVGLYENGCRVARCGTTFTVCSDEVDLVVGSDVPPCFKPRIKARAPAKPAPYTRADERAQHLSDVRLEATENAPPPADEAERRLDEYDATYHA